jgi:hypothetical protein
MRLQLLRVLTAALSGVVALIVVIGPASPAAAASCSGSTCTGKDPHSTGCDASGVYTRKIRYNVGVDGATLELRHSTTCKAFWTRFTDDDNIWGSWDIQIKEHVWSNNLQVWQLSRQYTSYAGFSGVHWTPMISALSGRRYYACADPRATGGRQWECTSWYQA